MCIIYIYIYYIYIYIYNIFYDNRCDQLQKSDRNLKQKLVREQIFKARAISSEALLNNERNPQVEDRLVLTLTYHPLLRDFQKVLNDVQILLTPNKEHKTVSSEKSPMIGWRKARTLTDYLFRSKINNKDPKESKSVESNGRRCQLCQYIEETCEFEDADGNK